MAQPTETEAETEDDGRAREYFNARANVGVATAIGALFFLCYCSPFDPHGRPCYPDLYFGMPFDWGLAQSDSDFAFGNPLLFLTDLAVGGIVGGLFGAAYFLFGGKRVALKWVSIALLAGALVAFSATRPVYPSGVAHVHRHAAAVFNGLSSYDERYGTRPGASVIDALIGHNRDGAVFLELRNGGLDPWGEPYDVSLSDQFAWVRSAGPDGLFSEAPLAGNTSDDIVRFHPLPPGWRRELRSPPLPSADESEAATREAD